MKKTLYMKFALFLVCCLMQLNIVQATCYNLTSPGQIGNNQSGCAPFDPALIQNLQSPSGGSNTLEYEWRYKNSTTGTNYQVISGATASTYDPGVITETTYYKRYAKRKYCTTYLESNVICVTVTNCCNATISGIVVYNLNNNINFLTLVNGGSYNLNTFPTNWNVEALVSGTTVESVKFTITGSASASNIENVVPYRTPGDAIALNWGPGTYTINAKVYSADNAGGQKCDEKTISITLTQPPLCLLNVNAGSDVSLCTSTKILTATSTGANTCSTQVITDCNHVIANSGGWLADLATSAVCGDNAGTKLWTKGGNGTSYITLDLGSALAAGTQICVNMKLEHCSNTSSGYSSAMIQASTSASSGFVNLVSALTFSQNTYQEYCYTLASSARYIKILDNGHCAFRVDYVKSIIPGTNNSTVTYSWSGPGIVGATNTAAITVNQTGTYIVTATDCKGCTSTDNVVVSSCCNLVVDAGADVSSCTASNKTLTATSTGAATCSTQVITDCNHVIANSGGWLADLATSAVCGDNAGTKLWTKGGNGTSYITLDLGSALAAGTQICVNMKLEHCSNTSSGYSSAMIQASTSASSGFVNLVSALTFSQNTYQEYCYTLASSARYIKILDNGHCALRVDYVKSIIPGTNNSTVTYSWSGPGIVGATNTAAITVNQTGTYIVTATDCKGCTSTDNVVVTVNNPDDNNVCTIDACDPATGTVTHTPVNTNDNNVCTTDACDPITGPSNTPINYDDNDVCTTDACDPITGPSYTPVNYDDNDVCTTDACDPITGPSYTPVNYDDNDVCTTDACDPITGPSYTPVNYDDNDVCTTDACDPITGPSNTPINYDDNDVCTIDACDPLTGPYYTPINYDDNDVCTIDACDPITGPSYTPINYDDNDVCTIDACDPITGPSNTPVNYDDNDVCTIDACDPLTGPYYTPINYDDNDVCTIDACDPLTGPSNTPVNYDDNDVCTIDACDPITGPSNTPVNYDDNDVCTIDACDPLTGPYYTPINYDDNDVCTIDACDPLTGPSNTPVNYDDNDVCTIDACDPLTGPYYTPINYDDNDVCTIDACDPITGPSNTPINYDDNDVCTIDACDPITGPSNTPINYDDNDVCTIDACDPITGPSNTPVNYDDNDVCTIDACDPLTGPYYTPINYDDNDVCTIDACDPLTGPYYTPINYDDNDVCTIDACDPITGPSNTPVNYDDNDVCTIDACDPLTGPYYTPINYDDNDVCTIDACDPITGPSNTPINYDDNDVCTIDACDPITGPSNTPVNYDDNDVCTIDACDPITGPSYTPINYDDNDVCTIDACDPITGPSYTPVNYDDNDVCTIDACDPLTGPSYTPINYDDNDVCTIDACDPITGPSYTPVNYDDNNACTIDGCDPVTGVYHNPVQGLTCSINGSGTCCSGDPVQLCVPASVGASGYLWSTGETTRCITVYTSGTYSVTVSDANGCTSNCDKTVTFYNTPYIHIPAFENVCDTLSNGIVLSGATPVGGTYSGNGVINGVFYPAIAGLGTHTITYTFDNGHCEASKSAPITVVECVCVLPLNPEITGITEVCVPTQISYTAIGAVGATNYFWTVSTGVTIVSGQGTESIVVSFSALCKPGMICVVASNLCGNTDTICTPFNTITKIPVILGNITGLANGVCAGATVQYCIASVLNTDSYVWTVPASANIIAGLGTNCITVEFLAGFTSGNITVKAQNCKGLSGVKTLTVRSIPIIQDAITGPVSNLCQATGIVYSIPNVAGATSYLWTVPATANLVSGQGSTSITVDFGANFTTGSITVKAVNACGTSGLRNLAVKAKASTPATIFGLASLCANTTGVTYSVDAQSGVTYTWTVPAGALIASGQGTSIITVDWGLNQGNVSVVAANACGNSPAKLQAITVINCNRVVAPQAELIFQELSVYPNPVQSNLTVEITTETESAYTITVTDMIGKVIYNSNLFTTVGSNSRIINVDDYARGLYFVTMKGEGFNKTIKITVE